MQIEQEELNKLSQVVAEKLNMKPNKASNYPYQYPNFGEDMFHAWLLVEAMAKLGFRYKLEDVKCRDGSLKHSVSFSLSGITYSNIDSDASTAILLATFEMLNVCLPSLNDKIQST